MTQKLNFVEEFLLSGVAAGVSKTGAAPIERIKLLVQNQDEMIKQGTLDKRYTGIVDCTRRTMASEVRALQISNKKLICNLGSRRFLARKPCQRSAIFPHPGFELCLQRTDQKPLRRQQGRKSSNQVRH